MNEEVGQHYKQIYDIFKQAKLAVEKEKLANIERLRSESVELLAVYTDEALEHLKQATTWELQKTDTRRLELRNNVMRPLESKMVELVKSSEVRDSANSHIETYDWFWKDVLPRFLQARAAHGRYIRDVLTHDMPNWQPLLDYCKVASNEL